MLQTTRPSPRFFVISCLALMLLTCFACAPTAIFGENAADGPGAPGGKADTTASAAVVDLELDGELLTDREDRIEETIQLQLLYTVGQLNGDYCELFSGGAVGNLNGVELTDITTNRQGEMIRVSYHARLPVVWSDHRVQEQFTFTFPKEISWMGQYRFATKYIPQCIIECEDPDEVAASRLWYYFRPARKGCELDDADVVTTVATVTHSERRTSGKYPEYHKIYEDGTLQVLALFAKYHDGSQDRSDPGISSFNRFVSEVRSLGQSRPGFASIPEQLPYAPGPGLTEVELSWNETPDRRVRIVALLTDNAATAGPELDALYEKHSERADIIFYHGHSDLGHNVKAFLGKGKWIRGQYVIMVLGGCNTYAYLDNTLLDRRRGLNPDDPNGTRYLDFALSAMPTYFVNAARSMMTWIEHLSDAERWWSYEEIISELPSYEVPLVTGEQDNAFVP